MAESLQDLTFEIDPSLLKNSSRTRTATISETIRRKLAPIKAGSGKRSMSIDLPPVKKKYKFEEIMGEGASAKVFRATSRSGQDNLQYAIKSLSQFNAASAQLYKREVEILNALKHPNILKIVEDMVDKSEYHIVSILCSGGELYERLTDEDEEWEEEELYQTVRTMLETVGYLHTTGIVHNDLKPSNWVYADEYEDSELVLIDFGSAMFVDDEQTYPPPGVPDSYPYYRSPEYVRQDHNTGFILKQSDMWAIGAMTYVLFIGNPPFPGQTAQDICNSIMNDDLDIPDSMPPLVADFVRRALEKDPLKRMTIEQAIDHKWMSENTTRTSRVSKKVLHFLRNFHHTCKFKRILARRLARTMKGEPQKLMREMFEKLDADGSGALDMEELSELITYMGWTKSEADKIAPRIMVANNQNADGRINFEQFSSVWQALALSNDDQFVHQVFHALDTDQDGNISLEELKKVLHDDVEGHKTAEIFADVDVDGNGFITFDEFKAALEQDDHRVPQMVRRQSFINFERQDSDGHNELFLKELISAPGRYAEENELSLIAVPQGARNSYI